ncbi:cadmium resistance transporter, partial [Microcystis wesenbergii]|uniref:cadmium resistance transporter n=1 Tax=Microcystis wesenbergii TaxID=44823 RepID=UPI001F556279
MIEIVIAISTGVAAFVATNLDDILILTVLFNQTGKLFRRRDIVIGQYIGFSLLVIASLAGFFGCFLIPTPWIRYLGLVPVILGIVSLLKEEEKEEEPENVELDLEGAKPQGVTKGFKGNQDKDSSQMNPKEIEWLRQPPKISIC